MNLRKLLPGVFVLLLVAAACAPPPPLRDDAMLNDTSLITNEPCTAPCWNGITPGTTAWSDALTILEDDPNLADPTTRADEQSEAIVAEWQRVEGGSCCQMVTLDGETVNLVFLRLSPSSLTVGDLIDEHGEPAYVVGSPYSDEEAIINLVYPDLSTVIYAFVAGATNGALSASSEVIGALYITPEDMDLLLQTSNLNAWDGYETYAYYDQSEFEITPSVTLTPTATQ